MISNTGPDTIEIQEDAVVRRTARAWCSMIWWLPVGRCRPPSIFVRRRGGDVVAAGAHHRAQFPAGRDRIDVPFTSMVAYDA